MKTHTVKTGEDEYICSFYPAGRDCKKCILGQKLNKKCPDGLSENKVAELVSKSENGQKVCSGRPVKKEFARP